MLIYTKYRYIGRLCRFPSLPPQRRGSVQSADPLLCGGTFCRYRTHSAAENEGRTAIERRRNECATVLRKATHCLNRTFRFRFPSSPPYEEHNIDILRKNRVFTRFFAPFWHFGSVTKKSRNADIFRILVGRELMSSDF